MDDDRDPLAPHSSTPEELRALIAAQQAGSPFLSVRDDAGQLHLHPLEPERSPLRLGRRAENDICLAWDHAVSGVHAELVYVTGEWIVVDDGLSTYGTHLNGQRVDGRKRLYDGDRLLVGNSVIAVAMPRPAGYAPTQASAAAQPVEELTDTQHRILVAMCRPRFASPHAALASNKQVAAEVFLSEDAVKKQLGALFARFGLQELEQNQKRAKLAELVLNHGLVSQRDYR